jgi:hypothetical protein
MRKKSVALEVLKTFVVLVKRNSGKKVKALKKKTAVVSISPISSLFC